MEKDCIRIQKRSSNLLQIPLFSCCSQKVTKQSERCEHQHPLSIDLHSWVDFAEGEELHDVSCSASSWCDFVSWRCTQTGESTYNVADVHS